MPSLTFLVQNLLKVFCYWTKTRTVNTALGNVQDFQRSPVLRGNFTVILSDWTSQACKMNIFISFLLALLAAAACSAQVDFFTKGKILILF